ncbi:DUF2867 domain-containing protein [Nocardia cyriacigeorgica]|uniref:DUF2867 domain-containing protein n=1 Tax=Nocardia cyriacigeorgica (strain GUH-2) TaxID=1127134 RepID=H6RD68_NOCCG|nr:DUF2867 domain-containing protein [Nocardia cyriacigeorgica]MBF6423169.1 DUF2867 domain-containing protein [Nocardia cyriacigeorgica]BDT87569.1 hypothetical protein FMUAM8_33330 [Nocardia cyriacigeorgica]BDU06962.1 hypothetical protein FMUBM48_32250 [Nocardia cyriacigeorgica]CCF63916.1 conserved protein of unknown function [Nocardia cyriacigeorgica GUH-2]
MRLPHSAHTAHSWRIHELAPDFTLEDVWALPTPGGPNDFDRLVTMIAAPDSPDDEPPPFIYRVLFAIRWKLGALLGWDRDDAGVGTRVPSLRDRLPADLRDGPRGPALVSEPFQSVYLTDDEWVSEIANRTVHALMHVSWVPDDEGGYRGQMAVLVKPNGFWGRAYMAAILPFRYTLVYPALMRMFARGWERGRAAATG